MNEDDIRQLFQIYQSGGMSEEDAALFKADIDSGAIKLPQEQPIAQEESLPNEIFDIYFSGRMDKQSMMDLESDIQKGNIQLPQGIGKQEYHIPETGETGIKLTKEATLGEKAEGVAETALTLGTGATGGVVGQILGTFQGLADEIAKGEFGTQEAAQRIKKKAEELASEYTYEPKTEKGKEYLQETVETIAPMEALTPMTGQAGAFAKPAQKVLGQAREAISPTRREYKNILRTDPTNKDVAKYELVDDTVRFDKQADNAIKQGFDEGVVSAIKAATPQDRKNMKKMLNIHKLGKKSAKFSATNRPADVVGKSLENRVKFLADKKSESVKELDTAANDLKGKYVNYEDSVDTFLTDLEDIGVKVWQEDNKLKINLKGSDVEGDIASQKLLNKIFERLVYTEVPDGYGIHKAKRFIDTQVSYGKRKANPLSKTTENLVKKLRRNLNNSLGEYSENYRNANAKYKETLESLEDMQKAAGTQIDLDGPNVDKALGGAMRKVLSNYGSRVNMIDALDRVEGTVKKYGGKQNDDLINQIIFVNEVDRMFGSPAPTGFKGQIQSAIQTGVEATQKGAVGGAIDLAKKGIEKAKGINEENAIKAMEAILNKEY